MKTALDIEKTINRRSLIGFSLGFLSIAAFPYLKMLVQGQTDVLLGKKGVLLSLTTFFPHKKTTTDYEKDRTLWLNMSHYQDIVVSLVDRKIITSVEYFSGPNYYLTEIRFKDIQSAILFKHKIDSIAGLNRELRSQMGYTSKTQWSKI